MLKMENEVSHRHLCYTPDSLYTGPNNMAQNRVLIHNIAISSYLQLCAKIVTWNEISFCERNMRNLLKSIHIEIHIINIRVLVSLINSIVQY